MEKKRSQRSHVCLEDPESLLLLLKYALAHKSFQDLDAADQELLEPLSDRFADAKWMTAFFDSLKPTEDRRILRENITKCEARRSMRDESSK